MFLAYLRQNGSHVTSITATGAVVGAGELVVLDQLPSCQHLQELSLRSLSFTALLTPDGRPRSLFNDSTSLTRLEVESCVFDSVGCAALSVLVNLQHLAIEDNDICGHFPKKAPHPLSSVAWFCLKHLTHLTLDGEGLAGQDMGFLESIPSLLQLELRAEVRLAPGNTSGFILPASLKDVSLTFVVLSPAVLAAATQLTRLVLEEVNVDGGSGLSGGSCLLEALSKLQHLDTFHVWGAEVDWPPASPAYSALLASSRLRDVVLHCQLPLGAAAQVFARSDKLQFLLELVIQQQVTPWSVADVSSVVSCCPALLELNLEIPTDTWADDLVLTALSQLTSLTGLFLEVDVGIRNIAACVRCLAALTRLRALELWLGDFSDSDHHGSSGTLPASQVLLPLAALRQLTGLHFNNCGRRLRVSNKAGPGQYPDVWLQLLEHAADKTCHPAITRHLVRQLVQQEAINAQQQHGFTFLHWHLSVQRQEVGYLRWRMTEQENRTRQQQQDLADLRQQLAEPLQQQQDLSDLRQQQEQQQQQQQQELSDLRQQQEQQQQQQEDLADFQQQLAAPPPQQQQQDLVDLGQQLAAQQQMTADLKQQLAKQQQEADTMRQQLAECEEWKAVINRQQQELSEVRQQLAEHQQGQAAQVQQQAALQQQVDSHAAQMQALQAQMQRVLQQL